MKVINVTPGLLPIPPNGWGAVEKIIWDYHLALEASGIKSEIKYLNDVKYDDTCVIHVHVANLAIECYQRGIPYIFTIHDHHAFLHGKDSFVFKQNLEAIEKSVISLSPCKFLVDYFGTKKLRYLSHAVNTDTFVNKFSVRKDSLLCVANNGYAGDQSKDRKGFRIAIEAAMRLDLPLTIAGPKNNENFFKTLPEELNSYSKLTKIYDLNEQQLIHLYNEHSVFLHFSELEAGHPNLTLLEAMSCGLPVVGTFEESSYLGMAVCKRDLEEAVKSINLVRSNYESFSLSAFTNSQQNSYKNRVNDLLKIYSEYRETIFGDKIINQYKKIQKNKNIIGPQILITFFDGVKVEILGGCDKKYHVKFIDKTNNISIYETQITNNMWCSPRRKYWTNWLVEVWEINDDGSMENIESKSIDLKDQKVLVTIDSPSLGDMLAYIGQVEAFQNKHECSVDCIMMNEELAQSAQPNYKNINFIQSIKAGNKYYASYKIGYFLDCWNENAPSDPRTINLISVACGILGLPEKEIKPKLSYPDIISGSKKKYVCIATQSTAQCKYWNNEKGWKQTIKFLDKKGFDVMCIDRFSTFGNGKNMNYIPQGARDMTGDIPLKRRMAQIKNAKFFIGLGSGLSWLAWALDVPVVLISGFSKSFAEFSTPYRVINENVCNGCWNNPKVAFDKGDWMWCPEGKNFECTKEITSEMVEEKINTLLSRL
jgi:autotransporter strand-loop-strand O-heptosyltransferase